MAKKKSKRKHSSNPSSIETPSPSLNLLCNINGESEINEFESCLAELSEQQHYNDDEKKVHKFKTENNVLSGDLNTEQKSVSGEANVDESKEEILWNTSIKPPVISAIEKDKNRNRDFENCIPNIQLEMARHLHMKTLSSFLLKSCPNIRMPTFERWVIDSKMEERQKRKLQNHSNRPTHHFTTKKDRKKRRKRNNDTIIEALAATKTVWWDPVIPSCPELSDPSCQRLLREIDLVSQKSNIKIKIDAMSICSQLCAKAVEATKSIYNMIQRLGLYQNLDKNRAGEKISLKKGKFSFDQDDSDVNEVDKEESYLTYSLVYARKKIKKPFVIQINESHYKKLKQMFNFSTQNRLQSHSKHSKYAFHFILFSLLLRYSSLSGGQLLKDLRGGGMQGGIHTQVFQYLHETLDCRMECFASPFNVYFCNYCSAFEEEQNFFGSFGNFFNMESMEGCFEANPPFAPGFMKEMVTTMNHHLNVANEKDVLLTFVIIVPSCKMPIQDDVIHKFAYESFQSMLDSPYFVNHTILKARNHGYIEAAQHLRPTRFKQSQYDTSVIVLQSKIYQYDSTWWDTFEGGLLKAFESRHEMEIKNRIMMKK